jgi:acyl-coenzyme A synthetase/AMP-(fatty) acid ligase
MSFVQNPLSSFPDRIYKTGDIGKVNENGELVFICRNDQQIKHMGHRIELTEIEFAVTNCEGVRQCCVVFDENKSALAVYFTADDILTEQTAAAFCRKMLPRYMTPQKYFKLETMPFTSNGKVDRNGLLHKFLESGR